MIYHYTVTNFREMYAAQNVVCVHLLDKVTAADTRLTECTAYVALFTTDPRSVLNTIHSFHFTSCAPSVMAYYCILLHHWTLTMSP